MKLVAIGAACRRDQLRLPDDKVRRIRGLLFSRCTAEGFSAVQLCQIRSFRQRGFMNGSRY